ncbi:acyl-CoA dehydrogenase family protein [Lacunimicrobium album]
MKLLSDDVLDALANRAEVADSSSVWPFESLSVLKSAGALGWSIPIEFGGSGKSTIELFRGHENIATACLTTAFILSQREAAIRHLLKGPAHLQQRYLPGLASGDDYATVGLSQLTTSRQHMKPSLTASRLDQGRYELHGEIPWVTGADQAKVIIVGATLDDGLQILVALPGDRQGVSYGETIELASLTGSRTSLVHCDRVMIEADDVLAGPVEKVLGAVGGGGLETSNLAVGMAEAATGYLEREAEKRTDLESVASHFRVTVDQTRTRLHALAQSPKDADAAMAIREECTMLALQATQTSLLMAKGAGFAKPHPVQRWTRQALFFLVWSCPRPVAAGVLSRLMA